jgi:hypothetical protein
MGSGFSVCEGVAGLAVEVGGMEVGISVGVWAGEISAGCVDMAEAVRAGKAVEVETPGVQAEKTSKSNEQISIGRFDINYPFQNR